MDNVFVFIGAFLVCFLLPLLICDRLYVKITKASTKYKNKHYPVLNVAEEFGTHLLGRFDDDYHTHSGERFRENYLVWWLYDIKYNNNGKKVIIDFTNCVVISPAWLEEVFSKLSIHGFNSQWLKKHISVKTRPLCLVDIRDYLK